MCFAYFGWLLAVSYDVVDYRKIEQKHHRYDDDSFVENDLLCNLKSFCQLHIFSIGRLYLKIEHIYRELVLGAFVKITRPVDCHSYSR